MSVSLLNECHTPSAIHTCLSTKNSALTERLAIVKIWAAMFRGARAYVENNGFIGVHNMPEIVSVTGACENVNTLFQVDYFGKKAFLAQSDQLYLELLTPHLGKVYAEMQSFRMEPDIDDRHLCQFSLFEIEHLGNLEDLMSNLTGIMRSVCLYVVNECEKELAVFGRDPSALVNLKFTKMSYSDAIVVLKSAFPMLEWGDDLSSIHEKYLCNLLGPVFITHYPLDIKFFNMKQNDSDLRVVNSLDMLLPGVGESAGAAEREHDYHKILHRLKTSAMYKNLKSLGARDEDFNWYLDAHKDKEIPLHSGAGLGMARIAQFLLGSTDIRESVPFLINRENLI